MAALTTLVEALLLSLSSEGRGGHDILLSSFVVEPLSSFSAIRIFSTFLAICTVVRLAGIRNARLFSSKFSNLTNSLNFASMFLSIRFLLMAYTP